MSHPPDRPTLKCICFNDNPGNINRLFFITETQCILGDVGAEYLNKISTNFGLLCGNILPAAR